MAGFIHISEQDGCSMGSHDFRALILAARDNFEVGEDQIVANLCEYFDATSDCLLVLKGEGEYVLNAFYKAIEKALLIDPSLYDVVSSSLINELLGKLRSDSRFSASSVGGVPSLCHEAKL